MSASDVWLVSKNLKDKAVCEDICKEFSYSLGYTDNFEAILDGAIESYFIILSHSIVDAGMNTAELVQATKQMSPESFLAVIVSDELPKEDATFLRKSGADLILLEKEVDGTSKLYFAVNQVLHANFIPLKTADLLPDVPLPFDIYHLMPKRKKFLKFHFAGDPITDEKRKKLLEVNECYFHRTKTSSYRDYIHKNTQNSAKDLAKRCRSNFISLCDEYTKLIFSLTDQSQIASYTEGQELLAKCKHLCEELLANIAEFPNAWEIINSSSIGEFGSVERAPAIAVYCGLFGLQITARDVSTVMLSALLGEIGILFLPPGITNRIRHNCINDMSEEEWKKFRKYPGKSLETALDRKLSIDERMRGIITSINERADGTGFPNGINDSKLGEGSQLIHFSKVFDKKTLLKMGQERVNHDVAIRTILTEEVPGKVYSQKFLDSMRAAILKNA